MQNNQLKNIIKLAMNLSLKENKEIIPYLQKAYQTIEINENKKIKLIKKKKEELLNNNNNSAKRNIQIIDELIKKESEILNKSSENKNDVTNKEPKILLS